MYKKVTTAFNQYKVFEIDLIQGLRFYSKPSICAYI